MKLVPTAIPDVQVVEPRVFGDDRGFFLETFHAERFREHAGLRRLAGAVDPLEGDEHSRESRRRPAGSTHATLGEGEALSMF